MARGWESKSIEAQQAEAGDKPSQSQRRRISAEEAARMRESESLRMQRQRVIQQIDTSRNERRRKQLQDALLELDEKLASLTGKTIDGNA